MDSLTILLIILLILWLTGFGFGLGGELIHVLLIIAFVVFLVKLFRGRL